MKLKNDLRYNIIIILLLVGIIIIFNNKLNKNRKLTKQTLHIISTIHQNTKPQEQAIQLQNTFKDYEGLLIKDKNNFNLLLKETDEVSEIIYRDKQWEPHLQNALKQLVKPGDKALVLGAHLGCHAILISKLVGDEGKVSIFEPNPHILKFLKANLSLNDVTNTVLFQKAAFSSNIKLSFIAQSNGNTGMSHVLRENEVNPKDLITVEGVSLDSIKEIKSIDVLQMDIEGAEPEAVYGATKLLDNSPNLIVFQEWSPHWIKDVDSYLKFWRSRGYKFGFITYDCNEIKELTDEMLKTSGQIDIIVTKRLEEIIKNFKPL